jgi:hypothetical protein
VSVASSLLDALRKAIVAKKPLLVPAAAEPNLARAQAEGRDLGADAVPTAEPEAALAERTNDVGAAVLSGSRQVERPPPMSSERSRRM